MPIKPREVEAEAPSEPHFALLLKESGLRAPIRPGASLWIVEDRNDLSKVFPLVLKKVSHKQLVFQMSDGKGGLTDYVYKLTTAKPLNHAALTRLTQSAPNAKRQL